MDANLVDQYQEIENLENMINIDGTQAILVDGCYYIPTNTKAILLPENDSQYVINDTGEILFDSNFEAFDNDGTIQYLENTQVEVEDQSQVVYYTDGMEAPVEMKDDDGSQNIQFRFMDNIDSSTKTVEIGGELINIESVLENMNNNTETENGERQDYQYIVKFENYDVSENNTDSSMLTVLNENTTVHESPQYIDVSKITGKNLLTGQTVTLDSYLEKVRNINKELTLQKAEEVSQNIRKRSQHTALSNLVNKKLTIGKTSTGQRLVGKVIHVGKKDQDVTNEVESLITEPDLNNGECIDEDVEELEGSSIVPSILNLITDETIDHEVLSTVKLEDNQLDATTILMDNQSEMFDLAKTGGHVAESNDEEICSAENSNLNQIDESMVEYVSRTLTNLMSMESVSKKLKRKNLFIKITEKIITGDFKPRVNVYQLRGHLEMLGGWEEEGYEEKWIFKLDEENGNNHKKFPESMRLTLSIVLVDGIIQSTGMNLTYCQEKCSICSKEFRTIYKLKAHLKLVHQIADCQFYCQLCDKSLEDKNTFIQHQQYHVERKELLPCSKCDKHSLTELKLAKHMLCHDPTGVKLNCTFCGEISGKVSTWRKHMLTHTTAKPYSCNLCHKQFFTLGDLNYHSRAHDTKNCYVCKVCNRTFSRYSNLQRHAEIHGSKNSRSAYSCSMCGCTYNYVSSLTRHIVQNHISPS